MARCERCGAPPRCCRCGIEARLQLENVAEWLRLALDGLRGEQLAKAQNAYAEARRFLEDTAIRSGK